MHRLGRRNFIRGMGAAGLFSPFVSLLNPREARAAVGSAKYLMIFHTTGTDLGLWRPTGSTSNQIAYSEMLEPLAALQDSLVIIEGLDSKGTANNHGAPGGLTGVGHSSNERISLEQFVGDGLDAQGVSTAFSSLILGGESSQSQSTFFRDGQALSPLFLPTTAFNTVFGAAVPGPDNGESAAERLARRQSILDVVNDQLGTLSDQLGSEERQKLELHADSIRELEERLTLEAKGGGGGAGCTEVSEPQDSSEPLHNCALLADMAATAFACDLTRVAAIEFGHHQATQIGMPEIGAGDWHQFLHGGQTQNLINVERWVGEQFVATAQKLQSLPSPDGDGSLYDHTLMIWTRGMGDAVGHSGTDMRFVLAGGAGGYLDTTPNGRYIQGSGEAHQRVLLNCCEAMGITNFSGFGSTDVGAGDREPLSSVGS